MTARLGIDPTVSHEAGTPVGPRTPRLREESSWLLKSSDSPEDGVELEDHLVRLLTILEPVTAELWRLIDEGYSANWFCYVGSHAAEHAVELERPILARLIALPGDLWLDVYGDD